MALALLALVLPTALRAAGFTVSVEQDTITLGESAKMTMSFEGGSPDAWPAPPEVPGLNIQDAHGESMVRKMANGQFTQEISHTFVVTPTHIGNFVIPSISATMRGQVFKSDPVSLTVTTPPEPPSGIDANNPEVAFVRLEVPKKTVYVGEVARARLLIYLREEIINIKDLQMTPPQAEGLTVGKVDYGQNSPARIGRFRYNIIPVNMSYTAVKVGKLSTGSAELNMNLWFGPSDFFGRPSAIQHFTLTNPPVTIESVPLPTDNVPPGFSGAVGHYTMNVSVSPTNIAVGDPVTVKVQINGMGALDVLTLPEQMGWQQFKVYPPTSDVQLTDKLGISGTKNFAITVVPENMDVRELPPFLFTYFDPDRKTYQTLSHPAVPLIVRPSAASLPPPTFSSVNYSDNPSPVQDVSPIKARVGSFAQLSPPLVQQPWFIALQAVPALAWLTLLVNRKQKERLANNPRLRRQRQVEQIIREGLKQLRESANANQGETFFATMFHLLQERIGERLDVPASAITEAVVEERLRPLSVPENELALLRELFQTCDQARYAPQTTNAELNALIPKVESALNDLKKVKA